MTVTSPPTVGYVVTVPGPGESWPKADLNQSEGRRGLQDPRKFLPLAFVDDPNYAAQLLDRGWEPDITAEFQVCGVGAHGETKPTVFATEEEAEHKISQVVARLRMRRDLRPAPPSGVAREHYMSRAPYTHDGGTEHVRTPRFEAEIARRTAAQGLGLIEQARVEPATVLTEAEDLQAEMFEQGLQIQLQQAEAALEAAQAARDQLADQAKQPQLEASHWAGLEGHVGIQHRRLKDGSEVFRGRKGQEVSPTFRSVDEAVAWRDEDEQQPGSDSAPAAPSLGRSEGSRPA